MLANYEPGILTAEEKNRIIGTGLFSSRAWHIITSLQLLKLFLLSPSLRSTRIIIMLATATEEVLWNQIFSDFQACRNQSCPFLMITVSGAGQGSKRTGNQRSSCRFVRQRLTCLEKTMQKQEHSLKNSFQAR